MNRRVLKHFVMVSISVLLISAVAFGQAATTQSKTSTTAGGQKSSTATSSKSTGTTTTAAKEKLDINSATKKQLMERPGIGDALSQKIIEGRPYKAKNELTQKKILTNDAYAKITDLIIAKQAATTAAGAAAKTSTTNTTKTPASTSTTT